jgi:hypothetical protein
MVTASAGDWATNVVTVSVGDPDIAANDPSVMTGTNTPVAITLSGRDTDGCGDSNRWAYSITSQPANGTLAGSGAHVTYTPGTNFEGTDSFQFTVRDGSWTSSPGTVTIYVVGAPYLSSECYAFGDTAYLVWTEDPITYATVKNGLLGSAFFDVERSASPNGPFTSVATIPVDASWTYSDGVPPGQTNFYTVALDYTDVSYSGLTYLTAFSNTNRMASENSGDLIAPNSLWYVTDWDEQNPANVNLNSPVLTIATNPLPVFTNWVAGPFGTRTDYPAHNPVPAGTPPLPPISIDPGWAWTNAHTIWAHCVLNLTGYTSQQLSNVSYSVVIDNGYALYINKTNVNEAYIPNQAHWGSQDPSQSQLFTPLPKLVAGTNSVDVIFWGDSDNNDYFSFVVTTNTCGQ